MLTEKRNGHINTLMVRLTSPEQRGACCSRRRDSRCRHGRRWRRRGSPRACFAPARMNLIEIDGYELQHHESKTLL